MSDLLKTFERLQFQLKRNFITSITQLENNEVYKIFRRDSNLNTTIIFILITCADGIVFDENNLIYRDKNIGINENDAFLFNDKRTGAVNIDIKRDLIYKFSLMDYYALKMAKNKDIDKYLTFLNDYFKIFKNR